MLLAAGLAACDRPVDVTAKPVEIVDPTVAEGSPAAINVSAPVDLTKIEDEIVRLLPADIAQPAHRVPKAACQISRGKQVCLDVRLWGRIVRDGQARLAGTAQGLELTVPLRYELSAQPIGAGSATTINGSLGVVASFAMSLDERWQPVLKLGQGFGWPQGAKIKVFDGETSLQGDVEPMLTQKLQKLASGAVASLAPSDLRQQVELVWRYLHYPMALSQDRQIWLRGTPAGLHFAGLSATENGQELRVAITARLQTFAGDRPAPLPPSPLAPLGSGLAPASGGIVLPAEVSYDILSAAAARQLPQIPQSEVGGLASQIGAPKVQSLTFFPSGKHLAVGVHISQLASGAWFPGHLVAYYLSTPEIGTGSTDIILSECELFGARSQPGARQKELPFLADSRFIEALSSTVKTGIGDKLTDAIELLRENQSLPLSKGLKLWLTPASAKVARLAADHDGLRLQIEVTGDLSIRRDGTDIASGGDGNKATP